VGVFYVQVMNWLRRFKSRSPRLFNSLYRGIGWLQRWLPSHRKLRREVLRLQAQGGLQRLGPEDAEELSRLHAETNATESLPHFAPHSFDPRHLRRLLSSSAYLAIAPASSPLVAFAFVRLFGTQAWIGYLVHPDHRQQGLANNLVALLHRSCESCGIQVRATTHKDFQASLKTLAPFRLIRELPDDYLEVELLPR
jgi:RimJ/RimL family protein N-acetyltransferase